MLENTQIIASYTSSDLLAKLDLEQQPKNKEKKIINLKNSEVRMF